MSETIKRRGDDSLFFGILLIGLGSLFLLDRLYVLDLHDAWNYWPFLIVAFGLHRVVTATKADRVGSGVWFAFIGVWLYVSLNEVWDLGFRETWPAVIVAWGIGIVWKSFGRPWPFLGKENAS